MAFGGLRSDRETAGQKREMRRPDRQYTTPDLAHFLWLTPYPLNTRNGVKTIASTQLPHSPRNSAAHGANATQGSKTQLFILSPYPSPALRESAR